MNRYKWGPKGAAAGFYKLLNDVSSHCDKHSLKACLHKVQNKEEENICACPLQITVFK